MSASLLNEELELLAQQIRRDHGHRLPIKSRDETTEETQLREERSRLVLEREVLADVAAERFDFQAIPEGQYGLGLFDYDQRTPLESAEALTEAGYAICSQRILGEWASLVAGAAGPP